MRRNEMYNFLLEKFKGNHEKRKDGKEGYGLGLKINIVQTQYWNRADLCWVE